MEAKRESKNWIVPEYPPLQKDLVGQAAVSGQLVKYPSVVRNQTDDPIQGQQVGNVSFVFLSEPKVVKGQTVYGYFKLRGNYRDENEARKAAISVIEKQDSKFRIMYAPVGYWVPLTDSTTFAKEVTDVTDEESQNLSFLHTEAMRGEREKNKKIMKEVRDRVSELKSGDVYDDPESLTYYSMRRVTELKLCEDIDIKERAIARSKKMVKTVRRALKRIEEKYSDYADQWIDRYNEERKKGGVPDYVPSSTQFQEYDSLTLEELGESSEED